jgi:hypothetical protein
MAFVMVDFGGMAQRGFASSRIFTVPWPSSFPSSNEYLTFLHAKVILSYLRCTFKAFGRLKPEFIEGSCNPPRARACEVPSV